MAASVAQCEGVDFFSDLFAVHDPNTLRAPVRNDIVLTQNSVHGTVECAPPGMRLKRDIIIHDPKMHAQLSHLRHIIHTLTF